MYIVMKQYHLEHEKTFYGFSNGLFIAKSGHFPKNRLKGPADTFAKIGCKKITTCEIQFIHAFTYSIWVYLLA